MCAPPAPVPYQQRVDRGSPRQSRLSKVECGCEGAILASISPEMVMILGCGVGGKKQARGHLRQTVESMGGLAE